ncbi:MAG: haloacid dehalogenase type II [Anaerolineae bacterium]|jgi:2-haloacid dehalogenase|nr:haloacid dehalogenase type II [Anaerolineae bacterium]
MKTIGQSAIEALTFDVFGSVTDWRSTVIREGRQLGLQKKLDVDWTQFAEAWRDGYGPAMHRVRTGDLPWLNIDALHRLILDDLLVRFNVTSLSEADTDHLNRVWHRLDPWPDARQGLERLRQRFIVAPLSNGNVSLLTNMARQADLRWDCILSAELVGHYKPDPEVYLTAAALLGLQPEQVMMVAAHNEDLKAARSVGFRTAFVYRTEEYGPNQTTDLAPDPVVDITARDFNDLADQLIGL